MFKKAFDTSLFIYASAAVFFATVVAALLLQQLWLLLLPVLLMAALLLLQKPVLLFYVLIASVPWSIEYTFSGGFSSDLPDEPLMLLAALAAIILLGYQCLSFTKKYLLHPLILLLVLQFCWLFITVITSTQLLISIKFLLSKSWYLLSFVLLPLLLLQKKQNWKTIAVVLSLSMMLVTAVGLVRHAANGFTFASINQSLSPFFRNHVNYSALLVCIIPLLFAFAKSSKIKWLKVTCGLLLPVSMAALYFSYARGAWLALAIGFVALWLLQQRGLWQTYVIAIVVCIAAVFWLKKDNRYLAYAHDFNTTVFHSNFKDHLVATYKLKDVTTAERFYRWMAGVRMVKNKWQTGFGPNTFYYNYKSYTITAFKTWVSNNPEKSTVHNYYLLMLIEQGIAGFLLFVVLLGYAFYTAQRVYAKATDPFIKTGVACAAVIVAMIATVNFLSDLVETDKAGSIFYLCISFLIIADVHTRKEAQKEI